MSKHLSQDKYSVCLVCETRFLANGFRAKHLPRYCSPTCYPYTKTKLEECAKCSRIFKPRNNSVKHCSKKCLSESRKVLPEVKTKTCQWCEKTFIKEENFKIAKYCSRNCLTESQKRRKVIECPVCQKSVTYHQGYKYSAFCSYKCKSRAKYQLINEVEYKYCALCQKLFPVADFPDRSRYGKRFKGSYCLPCEGKQLSKSRERRRKYRQPRLSNTKFGTRIITADGVLLKSKLEHTVDKWLHKNKIEHSHEIVLERGKRYRCDFYAKGYFIEIWGMANLGFIVYEKSKAVKLEIYKKNNLKLIEIFSSDFQENTWQNKLKILLGKH